MASPTPLHGTELIDCATANANQGIEAAADRCGYSSDLVTFERELQSAAYQMGIKLQGFQDLTKKAQVLTPPKGEIVAPDSATEL
jgi:hypothetical protein